MVNAIDESNGAESLKGFPIAEATESLMGWKVIDGSAEELMEECRTSEFEYCSSFLLDSNINIEDFILIFFE